MAGKASSLGGFAFEVHGRVQRVFFRNHAVDEAVRLGLVGWVANTARGTVTGEAQGPVGQLEHFKHWLREVGSPASNIERLDVRDERPLATLAFAVFERRPNVP